MTNSNTYNHLQFTSLDTDSDYSNNFKFKKRKAKDRKIKWHKVSDN